MSIGKVKEQGCVGRSVFFFFWGGGVGTGGYGGVHVRTSSRLHGCVMQCSSNSAGEAESQMSFPGNSSLRYHRYL